MCAMGLFHCVWWSNKTPDQIDDTTQGNRLCSNGYCGGESDGSDGDDVTINIGMASYKKRRICFMDGLLVLTIILTIIVDICFAVDATTPHTTTTTTLAHSVTNTISDSQSMRTTRFTPISTTPLPATTRSKNNKSNKGIGAGGKLKTMIASSRGAIQETLVIPSSDSEREAQEIYDKALEQFDSYGASTRKVCAAWEQRGCQCSGTVDELILSCRAISLNETPTDLPKNLIKL